MSQLSVIHRIQRAVLSLALVACGSAMAQESVTLSPTKDNSMFEEMGSLSNGAGQFLFTGFTNGNSNTGERRALIAFEDLSAISNGSTVDSVELVINVSRTRLGAGQATMSLHRVTSAWGQGGSDAGGQEGRGTTAVAPDATWTNAMTDGETWNNPGGDFDATASAQVAVTDVGFYTFESTPELIADVEFWLANPDQNFGWIIVMDNTTGNAKQIGSREGSAAPQLNLEFTLGEPVFPINFGHSGGWFNFDTAGQGVMIEVFPEINQVFLTWFTYEAAESAKIGSADHRWLSGLGEIDGGKVEIDLQVTSGAFFDDPTDPVRTDPGTVGTVILEFSSCAEGTMSYNLLDPARSNSFSIQRLAAPPQVCLDLADQVAR